MQFFHKSGNARLVVTPEDITWLEAQGGQRIPQRLRGETIEFTQMPPLNWGDGTVYNGKYYTNDPDEIEFLLRHKSYGIKMIGIQEDGLTLTDENWVFEDLPDGQVRCRLNNRIFKNRAGAESWKSTSNEYKQLLQKHNEEKARASEIQFEPVGDIDRYGELSN